MTRTTCKVRSILMSRPSFWALALGLVLAFSAPQAGLAADPVTPTLRVGVRADARPFSYLKNATKPAEARSLDDYDGFTVAVCRAVLDELVSASGAFHGANVKAVEVTAQTRFPFLAERKVDLLCGPDSIAANRLEDFMASYPVYLSGISFAYLRQFTQGNPYCGKVVGVVRETTADTEGLKALAEKNLLKRFDGELETALSGAPRSSTLNCPTLDLPELPVVGRYPDHNEAVKGLCARRILYYVGDVDILRARVARERQESGATCDVRIEPFTLSREVYAVLFRRKPKSDNRGQPDPKVEIDDALLYAEFNNSLLRKLQGRRNLLEQEFDNSFKGFQMSADLADFFLTMKITNGWKQ